MMCMTRSRTTTATRAIALAITWAIVARTRRTCVSITHAHIMASAEKAPQTAPTASAFSTTRAKTAR
jgi:hypothetical protein